MFSDDNPQVLDGGSSGGGKTQKLRGQVRSAAPTNIWLVEGRWDPQEQRVLQLASATTLDVNYVREDLTLVDFAYRLARHIRNTDETPVTKWAVQGMDLLAELQKFDPERYDREIKK